MKSSFVVVVTMSASVLMMASPSEAQATTSYAFAYISDEGGTITINRPVNTRGGTNRAWRTPVVGTYTVSFGMMYTPNVPHTVQVDVANGTATLTTICALTSEGGLDNDLLVTMHCYTPEGVAQYLPHNTTATVGYRMDDSSTSEQAGYARNINDTILYSWNSTGGRNVLNHTSTGHYAFIFEGVVPSGTGGTVSVSTRTPFTRCGVSSWGTGYLGSTVNVVCTAAGTALLRFVDANVSVYFGRRPFVSSGRWGYAWANQPTNPSYHPDSWYQGTSAGQSVTITRRGKGDYLIDFPGANPSQPGLSFPFSVTYGSNPDTVCQSAWCGPTKACVYCRQNGAMLDTTFVVSNIAAP